MYKPEEQILVSETTRDHAMFDAELSGAVLNLQLLNRILHWLRPYIQAR